MSINDIIPLDALFGDENGSNKNKKKKKVDRIALSSPMMRIPRMDVNVARDLIDIGINELFELEGRAPESLFEEINLSKRAHMLIDDLTQENDRLKLIHDALGGKDDKNLDFN